MSKELLREYIKKQNFSSPNEVLKSLKDLFKDVLQEVLEVEINVTRDRNGDFEPKIVPKYQRSVDGIEDKILSLYVPIYIRLSKTLIWS